MNILPNILIFSVFEKNQTAAYNEGMHAEILRMMQDKCIPHLELQGKYSGNNEKSILVEGFERRSMVENLCKLYAQECYLESHSDRQTFLVFPDGTKKAVGKLTNVSKEVAEASDSFSYNPLSGQYFVTA